MDQKPTRSEPKQGGLAAGGGVAEGGLAVWRIGGDTTRLDTLRDGSPEFDDLCSMAGVSLFDAFFVHFCEQR